VRQAAADDDVQMVMGSASGDAGRAWHFCHIFARFLRLRASAAYFGPQEFEHSRPSMTHNIYGKDRQTFAQPSDARNSSDRLVVKGHIEWHAVVYDA